MIQFDEAMLHEYAAALSAASDANQSRRLIKCAKDFLDTTARPVAARGADRLFQVAGEGQRIAAQREELRRAMKASEVFARLFSLKFAQVFMVQTAHTAVANARAHVRPASGALMEFRRPMTELTTIRCR